MRRNTKKKMPETAKKRLLFLIFKKVSFPLLISFSFSRMAAATFSHFLPLLVLPFLLLCRPTSILGHVKRPFFPPSCAHLPHWQMIQYKPRFGTDSQPPLASLWPSWLTSQDFLLFFPAGIILATFFLRVEKKNGWRVWELTETRASAFSNAEAMVVFFFEFA